MRRLAGALLLVAGVAAAQSIEKAVENRMERGAKFIERKEFEKAIAEFDAAIGLDAEYAPAYAQRGRAKQMSQDYDGALADYGLAVEKDPEFANARYWRALLLQWKQRHVDAVADLDRVIAQYPNWAPALLKRGESRRQLLRFAGAAEDFARAAAADPTNRDAWMKAAQVREDTGDYAGAEEIYTLLIEKAPDYAPGYRGRGRARSYLGNPEDSDADYEKAIALAPRDIENLLSRAQARMVRGDKEGALADCERAEDIDSKSDRPFYIGGLVHYNFGDYRKARRDFLKAIRRASYEPDYAQLYLFLARSRIPQFRERAPGELKAYYDGKEKEPDAWYTTVVKFLTGEIDEKAFLAAATDETPKKTRERRCEAYFYAGTMRLIAEDEAGARRNFENAVETGVRNFIEYQSAVVELKRMK